MFFVRLIGKFVKMLGMNFDLAETYLVLNMYLDVQLFMKILGTRVLYFVMVFGISTSIVFCFKRIKRAISY